MKDWNIIPDDELDDLFRKTAEGQEPPYEPEAWNALKEKLVAERPHRTMLQRLPYVLALLLLFSTGGYFYFSSPQVSAPSRILARSTAPALNGATTIPPVQEEGKNNPTVQPSIALEQALTIASDSDFPEHAAELPLPAEDQSLAASVEYRRHALSLQKLASTSLRWPVVSLPKVPPSPAPQVAKPLDPHTPRWGVRVVYSPDLSTVARHKSIQWGHNLGVLAEYRIAPRWLLQAGVIRAIKYYTAAPEDYNVSYSLANFKDIDAVCDMLDIPLNLRYDFAMRTKHRWFGNLGATSYLMLKEKYTYNYKATPDKPGPTWEGNTGFYPLGVINLGVGYERQWSARFSTQVEPFLKVPIQQVGYGNVKLSTAGVFISAKWNLSTQPFPRLSRTR